MTDWFSHEEFWKDTFDFMFPSSRFAETDEQITALLETLGSNPERALDLGCGPGRAAIELAKRNAAVTGVDRSPFMLAKARERGSDAGVDVEWVEADMRDFRRPGAFDLVLSLFTSFGYFEKAEDNVRVLENAWEALRPGGCLVLELLSKELLAKVFEPTGSQSLDDGRILVERRRILDGFAQVEVDWILLKDGSYTKHTIRHWLYSGQELKGMLLGVGFRKVVLHGDLAGSAFDAPKRLVAFAFK